MNHDRIKSARGEYHATHPAAFIGHMALSFLFLSMAALQLNDPDPTLWVVLYVVIAGIPAARAIGRRLPLLWGISVGLAIACIILSASGFINFVRSGDYSALGAEMSADKPYIESAREFLGTLIGAACLAGYGRWHTGR